MPSVKSGSRDNAVIEANVLGTALEIMLDGGLEALSVQEIAKRSGLAKTTIYRRWPSAEAIGIEALRSQFTSTYPAPDTGTLNGDLRVVYTAYRDLTAPPGFRRVTLSVMNAALTIPAMAEVDLDMEAARRDLVRPLIETAVNRGEIRADLSFEQIVALILGPIFHMRVRESVDMNDDDCHALADAVCRALA